MQTWTSVTTTNNPAWHILGHARHLMSQGAVRPIYFLDQPEVYSPSDFASLKRNVRYVICDDHYWKKMKIRPEMVPERQLINLKVARANCTCDWFLHIDADEFLHLEQDFFDLVTPLPSDITEIRLQNFERIKRPDSSNWHTGVFRVPCWNTTAISHYPNFIKPFLGLGLANYYHGKSFVKNRPNLTQGIHGGIRKSEYEVIRFTLPWNSGFIGHYQYYDREAFYMRLAKKQINGGGLLKHELAQKQWIAQNNFEQDAIYRLGVELFEATEVESERYRANGLFRDIPQAFIARIEGSFDAVHLNFSG
jgi:hypothetical protein